MWILVQDILLYLKYINNINYMFTPPDTNIKCFIFILILPTIFGRNGHHQATIYKETKMPVYIVLNVNFYGIAFTFINIYSMVRSPSWEAN